jgi:formylglycine-generating enzyme
MNASIELTIKDLAHSTRPRGPVNAAQSARFVRTNGSQTSPSLGALRPSLSSYDGAMVSGSRPEIDTLDPPMVSISAGQFSMGCETGRDDEKPVHRVWVDTFEIGAYQVTNAEYSAFLTATKRPPPPVTWDDKNFSSRHQPVVSVSWFDAVAYCDWLSRLTGRHYALPTEAHWEHAARGDRENELYPWGNAGLDEVPDYKSRWQAGPEEVGLYAPNSTGMYNAGDNVHEWCADWYSADYYSHSPGKNPMGPESGVRKASRGGSWRHHMKVTRTAARSSIPPEFKYADYGFRLARISD